MIDGQCLPLTIDHFLGGRGMEFLQEKELSGPFMLTFGAHIIMDSRVRPI